MDVRKAADIFIELSRGHESRPLAWSAKPYRLLATTGSTQTATTDKPGTRTTTPPHGTGRDGPGAEGAVEGFEPFPDELVAMQKLAAEPTDASRKALAAIRVRYAIAPPRGSA